jgi:hypothetical protein
MGIVSMRGKKSAREQQATRKVAPAVLIGMAVALSACSSASERDLPSTESGTPSFTSRFSQLFGSAASSQPQAQSASTPDSPEQIDCPPVDVRQGASTLSINGASKDPSAMGLRYQGIIGQTARECAIRGGNLTIKVGIQGRMILGPAGGAGQMDVPLRYALVQEGPEPKTLWTRLYRVPVVIGDGQSTVPFSHVEEDLTVPKPAPGAIDAYVIYVGFDPLAMGNDTKKKPATPQRRR